MPSCERSANAALGRLVVARRRAIDAIDRGSREPLLRRLSLASIPPLVGDGMSNREKSGKDGKIAPFGTSERSFDLLFRLTGWAADHMINSWCAIS